MNACHRLAAVLAVCALAGCAMKGDGHRDGHGMRMDGMPPGGTDCVELDCPVKVGARLADGLCVLTVDPERVNVARPPDSSGRREEVTITWKTDRGIDLTGLEIGNGQDDFDRSNGAGEGGWKVTDNRRFVETPYKYQLFGKRTSGSRTQLCASGDPWIYNK